jgi:hypothetical protein
MCAGLNPGGVRTCARSAALQQDHDDEGALLAFYDFPAERWIHLSVAYTVA